MARGDLFSVDAERDCIIPQPPTQSSAGLERWKRDYLPPEEDVEQLEDEAKDVWQRWWENPAVG